MWKQPFSYKEGIVITLGLMLTGAMLQVSMGPLDWDVFLWPANIIALAVFIAILAGLYIIRCRSYFIRFMTSGKAAVPAITGAMLLTLIMGLTRQVSQKDAPADPLGFTKMLECWPFILVYVWMTAIVGEVTIKQVASVVSGASRLKYQMPGILSHLGLFIVLTCGTLGSADMQRLKMYCEQGKPEWRALDVWNNVHELPVAIELKRFHIDEYPPKLMVIDGEGKPLPYGKPDIMEVKTSGDHATIAGWKVTIEKKIDNALPSSSGKYVATNTQGSESAVLVKAQLSDNKSQAPNLKPRAKEGWVTCGSYMFKYEGLPLDNNHALVMASREPERYSSLVDVYTEDGKSIQSTIEVNHPLTVNGWKIYQLSYDEQKGKWSTLSVFELVSDPWLPAVYFGILLLALGAAGMMLGSNKPLTSTCKPQAK